jgi:hypothetical protein
MADDVFHDLARISIREAQRALAADRRTSRRKHRQGIQPIPYLDPIYRTSTVVALAQQPGSQFCGILADSLDDAGFPFEQVLARLVKAHNAGLDLLQTDLIRLPDGFCCLQCLVAAILNEPKPARKRKVNHVGSNPKTR